MSRALVRYNPGPRMRRGRPGKRTVRRTRGPYNMPGEMKYLDTEGTNVSIATGVSWNAARWDVDFPTDYTLVAPTQGTGINQRIGRKIRLMKLKISGQISVLPKTDNQPGSAEFRILLVQDMQTNGIAASGGLVMQDSLSTAATGAVLGFRNLVALSRFRIIGDRRMIIDDPNNINISSTVFTSTQSKMFKFSKNFGRGGLSINYNGTSTGQISDVVDNSFAIYALCDTAQVVSVGAFRCRAYFKE